MIPLVWCVKTLPVLLHYKHDRAGNWIMTVLGGSTWRMPGSRSEKCFSRAVLLSLDRTKEAVARADRVRICKGSQHSDIPS